MKKTMKKALSIMLVAVIMLTAAPLSGFIGLDFPEWLDFSIMSKAAETSGTCGEKLTWVFDDSTGTLTISGSGKMDNYGNYNFPWDNYKNSIKAVIINDGATNISNAAFYRCVNLESVVIGYGVVIIGSSTFSKCTNLKKVAISNSVTSIEKAAFDGCQNLKEIYYGGTVEEWRKIKGIYDNDNFCMITVHCKDESILNYPAGKCGENASWEYDPTTCILTISGTGPMYDFSSSPWTSYKSKIKEIVISNEITTIGNNAFRTCKSITSITIPNSVTSIGEYAFEGCSSLVNVTIPNSVTTIGNYAFGNCKSIVSITIPDSVTTIGNYAFKGCESLVNITIPNSVTSIGNYAFEGCSSLVNVTISNSVKTIGNFVFNNCTSLTEIHFDGTSKDWNSILFGDMNDQLFSLVIICTDKVLYPTGVCGENVVWEYNTLTGTLTISGTGDMYDRLYEYSWEKFKETIKKVVVNDGVTSIGDFAFRNCTNLESVTISDSATKIGRYAFDGCGNLKSLSMPAYNYGVGIFNEEFRCPSKITLLNSKILLDFTKGDQTTIVEIGKDVESFEPFTTVLYACGAVEKIILHKENNNFKLIDGVLYNSDITELCLYPTESDKREYIMPDTVVSEFATSKIFSEEIMNDSPDIVEYGGPICSVRRALNLEKLVFGKNYRYCMTDYVISEFDKVNGLDKEETKISRLIGISYDITWYEVYPSFACNSIKEFSVHEDNKYLSAEDGILYVKQGDYRIAIASMEKSIDNLRVDKNELYNWQVMFLTEIKEIEFTDEYLDAMHFLYYSEDADNVSDYLEPFAYSRICSYKVSETNDYFTTVDGFLYSKDGKILVGCSHVPVKTTYVIPETVELIGKNAFGFMNDTCINRNENLTLHITEETCNLIKNSGYSFAGLSAAVGSFCFENEEYLTEVLNTSSLKEYNSMVEEAELAFRGVLLEVQFISEGYDSINKYIILDTLSIEIIEIANDIPARAEICNGVHHEHNFEKIIVAPTCTEKGYTTYTCSDCGEEYTTGKVDATGHKMSVNDKTEPGCVNTGSTSGVICSICGEIFVEQEEIPAVGHSYNSIVIAPTCTSNGYTMFVCSACDDTYITDEVDALGHTKTDTVIENRVDATCNDDGYYDEVIYCAVCGEKVSKETKIIPATEQHSYKATTVESHCMTDGYTTFICSVCGDTYTETIVATGHSLITVDAKEPTCTEVGYEAYEYCSVCDYTTFKEIEALGHKVVVDDKIDPDCLNKGFTSGARCSICNEVFVEQEEIPAVGHIYDSVVTAPTCTTDGFTTYTCHCGDTYTDDEVSALGHTDGDVVEENYVAPTCTETGSKDNVTYCTACDVEINREQVVVPATGHNMINGACENCDYTENEDNKDNNDVVEPSDDCSCNCHKSGISKFFFNFVLFFQKLFGSNKECACGVAHY